MALRDGPVGVQLRGRLVLRVADDALVDRVCTIPKGVCLALVGAAVHRVRADGLAGCPVSAALPTLAVVLSDAVATLRTLENVRLGARARPVSGHDRKSSRHRLAASIQRESRRPESIDAPTRETVGDARHVGDLVVVPVPVFESSCVRDAENAGRQSGRSAHQWPQTVPHCLPTSTSRPALAEAKLTGTFAP